MSCDHGHRCLPVPFRQRHHGVVGTLDRSGQAQRDPGVPTLAAQPGLHFEHRVAPAQLLLAELLSLPNAELAQRVDAELGANPALELPTPLSCPGCGSPLWSGSCVRCSAGQSVGSLDVTERIATRLSPRDELLSAAAAALTPAQRTVAAHLLADTNELGVLTAPVEQIAIRLRVPVRALREIIRILRATSGRAGLCAETLVDRLRQEVRALAEHERVPDAVQHLIRGDVGQLVGGPAATGAAGLTASELAQAVAWLRRRLTAEVFEEDPPLPPPQVDIVVRRVEDGLGVTVVPGPWSAVRVAESYLAAATMMPAVAGHLARARDFVDALARRERTLLRVAESTVRRQAARVMVGTAAHRPLTRREIAAELTLHESTVSRVVAGRYILLPTGEIISLAALFGAARGVQDCLREVIRHERDPLSDAELVQMMAARGHHLARRTVAKYRAALGIPDYRSR